MISIQCKGCLKIMEVEEGKEKLKWFNHRDELGLEDDLILNPTEVILHSYRGSNVV